MSYIVAQKTTFIYSRNWYISKCYTEMTLSVNTGLVGSVSLSGTKDIMLLTLRIIKDNLMSDYFTYRFHSWPR